MSSSTRFGFGGLPVVGLLALITGSFLYQPGRLPVTSTPSDASEPAPVSTGGVKVQNPSPGAAATILSAFLGDKAEAKDARAICASAKAFGVSQMNFLVATIPDYVDSSSDWTADPSLDAIQRAAGALGFRFDRCWFPDWDPAKNKSSSGSGRKLHETQSGIVLFRRIVSAASPEVRLLVVFLVNETPTGGIYQEAFQEAARTIKEWSKAARDQKLSGEGPNGNLLILGPTFSGSSLSLHNALRILLQDKGEDQFRSVRFVSGTATNSNNQALLTFDRVTYQATVHTDDDLLDSLVSYLSSLNPEWRDGNHVALISEMNTVYGSQFQSQKGAFAKALRMSFPLHISRLRAAEGAVQKRSGVPSGLQPDSIAIPMEQQPSATDQIPSFTPELTSAIAELTLSNILDTIHREGITAVGIFATDKRDHLFLSREIFSKAPNVLLFTTESDLIFIHPDFASFVRGTIVASSYPLHSGAQRLTNPTLAARIREQFPSMGTQGRYNAMLALLAPWSFRTDGTKPSLDEPSAEPLDYSFFGPADKSDRNGNGLPPVWISVVGRKALWPISLAWIQPRVDGSTPYTMTALKVTETPEASFHAVSIQPPAQVRFLFFLIILATLAHGMVYLLSARLGRSRQWLPGLVTEGHGQLQKRLQDWANNELPVARLFDPGETSAKDFEEPVRIERRRFQLICFCILGLVTLWMWRIALVWRGLWTFSVIAFLFVAVLGFLATTADRASLLRKVWPPNRMLETIKNIPAKRSLTHYGMAFVTALLMGLPAAFAAWWLTSLLFEITRRPPEYAGLLYARSLSPDNWVSQAPFVLLAAAALYLWALWNVRQLSMRGDAYDADSGLLRMLGGEGACGGQGAAGTTSAGAPGREQLRYELAAVLASPWRRTRPELLAGTLGVVATYAFFAWNVGYGIDGLAYARFFWWTTLLVVFVLAHSVSQTIHLASLLRRTLTSLGVRPMSSAFKRIAEAALFDWRLSALPSRAQRLLPALGLAQSFRTQYETVSSGQKEFDYSRGTPIPVPTGLEAGTLENAGREIERAPDVAFLRSKAWPVLVEAATKVQCILESGALQRSKNLEARPCREAAEDYLAFLASFVLRDMLSRVVTGLTVALAMALLICGSHLFYPFQGRHLIVWLDLAMLASLAMIGAWILVQFEKDAVLSRSWSTTPGRINWTGGLIYRIGIWLAVSLLTIIAARFPELGSSMMAWIEPLTKNLP